MSGERRRSMMGGKKAGVDYSLQYFTLKALQSGTFTHTRFPVDYSVDGGDTWSTLSAGSSTPTVQAGTKVMFRGTITPYSSSGVGTFTGSNNFEAEGNVMSLLYGNNFIGQVDLTGKDSAFCGLFRESYSLKSAKNLSLPATTLSQHCYDNMFYGCSNLTSAPELPATTLANYCYFEMFYSCRSLTVAPELTATTLAQYCYADMFYNCVKLTSAPAELPATTLALRCCYRMFMRCTSLTKAPALPATTLADSCYYYMFSQCPLTTAPELPATTMANACYAYMFGSAKFTTIELPATTLANQCYQGMLSGNTNLTTIELPATTLESNCYTGMFSGCTNLSHIKAMFTTEPSDTYTKDWVYNVPSGGTFVKNSAAMWNVTGVNGIPSGWTVQTAAA